mgnify:CR=1 FL=1|jgi:hypothetical protein
MKDDQNEYSVNLLYRSKMTIKVAAKDVAHAHKKAYDTFMDSSPYYIFDNSSVKYSLVETSIEPSEVNKEGSDVLHD